MALREFPMAPRDPAVAIEGVREFLEHHAACYGVSVDTPSLRRDGDYRVVVACRCGDTVEYWLADAVLHRQHLLTAIFHRRAA